MYKLVLIRHGESTWNLENRFTGWTDVDLTPTGVSRPCRPASCSRPRATTSTWPTPACSSAPSAPCGMRWTRWTAPGCRWSTDWRLNERHYGALQGLNKADMAKQYGDAQVLVWRRSYDTPPPALEPPTRAASAATALRRPEPPRSAADRMPEGHRGARLPFWNESMAPAIKAGKRVVVAAHGNSSARWSSTWTASPTPTSWA
jgi:2,3-bisphosphoglycerate-dependent phosphoglycerate mutase